MHCSTYCHLAACGKCGILPSDNSSLTTAESATRACGRSRCTLILCQSSLQLCLHGDLRQILLEFQVQSGDIVILGSDGLWDNIAVSDICDVVEEELHRRSRPSTIAQKLVGKSATCMTSWNGCNGRPKHEEVAQPAHSCCAKIAILALNVLPKACNL